MIGKIQLVILFLGISLNSFSQGGSGNRHVVIHKVQPGQTVYTISKTYGLKPDEIKQTNPSIDSTFSIHPGQILRVEVPEDEFTPELKKQLDKNPITHTVAAKETLFSISKSYNATVDEVKSWNKLKSNDISIGQELTVGWRYTPKKDDFVPPTVPVQTASTTTNATPKPAQTSTTTVLNPTATASATNTTISRPAPPDAPANVQEMLKNRYLSESNGSANTQKEGFAIWFSDDNRTINSKYYGLFSGVPVGSVIQVTNLMNQKTVWVKVIGSLPDTAENHGALVKLTPLARKAIVGNDAKVRVRVQYNP